MGIDQYERLDARAYAARMGCSLASAYRDFETISARQSDPAVLRLALEPVRTGKGATRLKAVVLFPVGRAPAANDNAR